MKKLLTSGLVLLGLTVCMTLLCTYPEGGIKSVAIFTFILLYEFRNKK